MDTLTTDGIIERLKKIRGLAAMPDLAAAAIGYLIDEIINARNKTAFTLPLLKAHKALLEFGRCTMLPDLADALVAIEGLLNAEVFLGPVSGAEARIDAAVAAGKLTDCRLPWERSLLSDGDAEVLKALQGLRRVNCSDPNVDNHTRFVVNVDEPGAYRVFYVDIHIAYANRFKAMVRKLPKHIVRSSLTTWKPGAPSTPAGPQAAAAAEMLESMVAAERGYDQLVDTYRAMFAAYLEGEFSELMRGSGRSMVDSECCYDKAVERLRGHAGVSIAMVPEICEGALSFTAFMDRVSKERWLLEDRYIAGRAKKQAEKLQRAVELEQLANDVSRGACGGWLQPNPITILNKAQPKANPVDLKVGVAGTFTMPIEPSGRPGDLLIGTATGLMWRAATSDGRVDPTIFGAQRLHRI